MNSEGTSPPACQPGLPHRQIRLQAAGQTAWVDEDLAPLVRELWQRGVRTLSSCQGVPAVEPAYISMPSQAAEQFLTLVVEAGGELAFRAYRAPPARSSIAELLRDIRDDQDFFNQANASHDPSMWHWTAAPRWDTADPPGLAITAWFPAQELGALTAAISQLIPRPPDHRR